MTKPVGLSIGSRKNPWKIGTRIGSGACASVHSLLSPDNKDSGFVIKIVPLPTKITKKKQTPPERNARLLNNEELLYRNQFPDYQGLILPKLPPFIGPPISGDTDGYRYLVLERMKSPLWDLIPALLKSNSNSTTIDLSPIAQQLLLCVESIHEENHLLVDIKPENFMLAHQDLDLKKQKKMKNSARPPTSNSFNKKSTECAQALARKIRVLDLGLMSPWSNHQGHKEDEGIPEVVGTPLYSSLNVHDNHTPSRRDDMEAMGYVIAELIIRLVAEANDEAAKYEGKNDADIPTYLPWSREKSDDAIGTVKAREVKDIKSKFYERMGDKEVAKKMKSLFDRTQSMKFKEKPDYAEFHSIFSDLQVSVEPRKKKASRTTKSTPVRPTRAARATRAKRSAVSDAEDSSEEERKKSPDKKQKTEDENFSDAMDVEIDVDDDDDDDKDEVFEDAMEWESEENPEAKENRGVSKTGASRGVLITVEEGPHKGEHFELISGEKEEIIVGQNPKLQKPALGHTQALWPLNKDEGTDANHVLLSLHQTRQLVTVNLKDLGSESGTWVDHKQISGSRRVFINDKFVIGSSTFKIRELPKSDSKGGGKAKAVSKKAAKATKSATASAGAEATKKPLSQKNQTATAKSDSTTKPEATGKVKAAVADILLVAVSGPHKGQSWALSSQGVHTINFGSEKSVAKKGQPVVLDCDGSVEKQHARFVLVASKKLAKVAIVSLADTFVNGKKTRKNKEHMAFVGDRCKIGETVVELRRGN